MQQYNTIKTKYPDAILLFRVGDFYETFGSDAIRTSQILGITLTKRNNGDSNIELAGFPHHSIDSSKRNRDRASHSMKAEGLSSACSKARTYTLTIPWLLLCRTSPAHRSIRLTRTTRRSSWSSIGHSQSVSAPTGKSMQSNGAA